MFTLPQFNLTANIWHGQVDQPPVGDPDVTTECQLYVPSKPDTVQTIGAAAGSLVPIILRVPAGTDIRAQVPTGSPTDMVECPAGSGRFYLTQQVDDAHKGFDNEYRFAVMVALHPWPTPIP